ncbi:2OG-Fe(II) oxygenase [Microbulbifer mangrovi]|uniref:2OG-Fe(II) oxygenase n=1 Tax=Microbulbifer mangrovi TaxID=927787 RepID=UPI00195BA8F3|nr:2OG-Fe(II) oxygenase [Microbulbifer mangrovi]
MEFAELQSDLQQWMRDAVRQGQSQSTMIDALLKAGYQTSIAGAVEQCFAACGAAQPVTLQPSEAGGRAETASAPGTSGKPDDGARFRLFEPTRNLYDLGDRQVEVLLSIKQPNIVMFGNLLSDTECDALIEMSREKLTPSRVVNADRGTYDVEAARTSSGTYYRPGANPLIAGIESRIERLLGIPASRGESMQILHYEPGAEYRPHFDFFNPERAGNQRVLSRGGQRVGTMIMYLNDVEAGGSTVFPRVSLDVLPKKGCGLFFSYANERGELDQRTLHGGSPVIAGEKWIATKWLRLEDYVCDEA